MKIDFFDVVKYGELYDKYNIMCDKPKTIEQGKPIYYYGDTLRAYIWNENEYVEYVNSDECIVEGFKYSKIELAYEIGKWCEDMYLFTEREEL